MNIETQLGAFTDYYLSHGGQMHYVAWSASPESPYGVFVVDHEQLDDAGSPLSFEEAEAVASSLTASWHTWMYCCMNPLIPDGNVLITIEKMNEIINKLKALIAARDELKAAMDLYLKKTGN